MAKTTKGLSIICLLPHAQREAKGRSLPDMRGKARCQERRSVTSRDHCKEQKNCEDDQVYHALQYRGSTSAQRDHAHKECQSQEKLVLAAQPQFQGLL